MTYLKIASKYKRKYGKTLNELSSELNVPTSTLSKWGKNGFDLRCIVRTNLGNKRIRKLWKNIQSRCGNPKDKKFKYYGGKGVLIKMGFADLAFIWKRDNADDMIQPSIDRIDSNGHYELGNCRFVEMEENRKRRSNESSSVNSLSSTGTLPYINA